jgi:DNA-binding LacI/PurR family transcriptional regulator
MQRAAAEAGIAPVPIHSTPDRPIPVSPTDWDHYARIEAGHLLAAFGPKLDVDAIMVTSDRDAFITAAAVRLFGKEPGRDVLIAGYDNTYTLCEEHASEPSMPTLTVDKRRELTGEMMIQLLTDRASGRLPDAPQVRAVPPVVIEVRGDPARARPETSPGSEDPV